MPFAVLYARSEPIGPAHGREEVVVVSVEEYRRIKGEPTGQVLIDLMQNSPLGDIEFDRVYTPARTRRVKL